MTVPTSGGARDRPRKLRLVPDLVPAPLWGLSAYRLLGRSEWKAIRLHTLAAAHDTCSACGTVVPGGKYMVCDEVWTYNDQSAVATLTSFRMLCPACDKAKHFGRASQIDRRDLAREQLASVNGLDLPGARAMQTEAMKVWTRRSALDWTVDVQPKLIRRWSTLKVLVGLRGSRRRGEAT